MFDETKLYLNTDEALDVIAPRHTRNDWRYKGVGPAYIKLGGLRIAYSGKDLNEWLRERRIEPADRLVPAAA